LPESIEEFYTIEWDTVKKAIPEEKDVRVLIQVPEGLKPYSSEIVSKISSFAPNAEVVIDLNPIYGSCMIMPDYIRSYDIIVHFGHDPYPLWIRPKNVLYVPLRSKTLASEETIENLTDSVRSRYGPKVAVYTTQQHYHDVARVASVLTERGLAVINDIEHSVITGCWFSDLDRVVRIGVDAIVVYAGGRFHALGIGLRVRGDVPVLRLDPYRDAIEDFTHEVRRTLMIRYGKVQAAFDAESFMVIDGVSGQHRPNLVKAVSEALKAHGYEVFIGRAFIVNVEALRNIDSPRIDSYVIASCPRLAVEDLATFHKPVLTPGEATMVAKRSLGRYVFPW